MDDNSRAPNRNLKFYVSNGILSIVGYIFNKSMAFVLIPILTKMMSTEEYGALNSYLAWVGILAYIVGLALEYSVRTAYVDYHDSFSSYISSIIQLSLVSLFVVGLLFIFLNSVLIHRFNTMVCILCIVHAYTNAIITVLSNVFIMQEKILSKTLLLIIPSILSVVVSILLIAHMNSNRQLGRIWGYLIVYIPLIVFFILIQLTRFPVKVQFDLWKYALCVSVPMVFHGLSHVVLSSSDRIIINYYWGDRVTGIYSLAYNFIQVVLAIQAALESIWVPWFTQQMKLNNENVINRVAKLYLAVITAMIAGLMLLSPELLIIVSSNDYADGKKLLLPLLLSNFAICLYYFAVCTEIYYKKTRSIAINTGIAAIINLILDLALVPTYGMMAAAYVTFVSYVILTVMHYKKMHRLNDNLFPYKMIIIPFVIIILVSIFSVLFIDNIFARWTMGFVLMSLCLAGFVFILSKSRKRN